MRKHPDIVFLILALLLIVGSAFTMAQSAKAVIQSDIDTLKADASALSAQKKELQKKIDALSADISNNLEKKQLLDSQIAVLEEEISNAEAQIATYEAMIAQSEEQLTEAEALQEAQYDLFCRRVRAMEEQGTVAYWSVLFNASNFSDMLSRLDMISEIMEADQRVIDQFCQLQADIQGQKELLELQKTDAEAVKADLDAKKAELDQQRTAANQLIAQLRDSQSEVQEDMDDLSSEADAIQNRIVQLSKELAAQQAASSSSTSSTSAGSAALGGYIWPVSSRYITSTFGGRSSPGGIGSTNHQGIDIGRVYYSTEIHAAKAGTVIISQYSSSYGNYVVVSHGSGNTTLYAHMSSRSVSVGQTVARGAVLGITGSTGNSTGPHLHFEITENGVRIDPLKYLTGYTLAG